MKHNPMSFCRRTLGLSVKKGMKKIFNIDILYHKRDIKNYVAKIFLFSSFFFIHSSLSAIAQPLQKGKASFYAKKFTGRKTANGEIFHHDSMTCAHRHYDFGTLLKVTNPRNGKSVVVRVNDRGPFVKGRIIDLSWKAADELGIIKKGVETVRVEPLFLTFIPYKYVEEIEIPEFEFKQSRPRPFSMKPEWQELKELNDKE